MMSRLFVTMKLGRDNFFWASLEILNMSWMGRRKLWRRKQFWAVSFDLNKIFYLYPFLVPEYFALITRAMIVLEGIAVTGDPDFDLFKSAYPYSLKRAVSLFGYP